MNPYTIEQWIEDARYVTNLPLPLDSAPTDATERLRHYFHSKYRDEGADRFARFDGAIQFLNRHLDSLGDDAALGDDAELVSKPLTFRGHGSPRSFSVPDSVLPVPFRSTPKE